MSDSRTADAAPVSATAQPRGSAPEILLVAACGALIAAAWYVGWVGVRFGIMQYIVHVSRDIGWMAPLAYLIFFGFLALPAAVIARYLPRPMARRLAFGVFAALTIFSIAIPYSELADLAVVALSLGVGVAAARASASRPEAWLRAARRAVGLLVPAFVTVAVAVAVSGPIAEWRATRSLPPATAGAPNVLLIVLDAVRASAFSSYGYPRETTPHLDALAQEGALFEFAVTVAPWTLPSHESMFTGEYQLVGGRSSSFVRRPVADDRVVIPSLFQQRGYETAGFVANMFYTAWDSELDRGFAKYVDYPRTLEQTLRSSSLGQLQMIKRFYREVSLANVARFFARPDFNSYPRPANSLKKAGAQTDQFLSWLDAREPRPFFVFMNYFDAHEPYDPPAPFRHMFSEQPVARDLYDGAIAYMDREVNRILDALRNKGILDSTLVIVTSDHGELFGENGLTGHHSNLYFNVLHVPLIMRLPGRVPAGARVTTPVSLRDLAATIADLTALPERDTLPGVSLAGHWQGGGTRGSPLFAAVEKGVRVDSTLPFAKGDLVSVMDEEWHYIRNNGTGKEELYRYREDGDETTNLAARTGSDSVLRRMRGMVDDVVRSSKFANASAPSR